MPAGTNHLATVPGYDNYRDNEIIDFACRYVAKISMINTRIVAQRSGEKDENNFNHRHSIRILTSLISCKKDNPRKSLQLLIFISF